MLARLAAHDTGIGSDAALIPRVAELLADGAVGSDTALIVPNLLGVEGGVASDAARPGVHGIDGAVSSDSGLIVPRFAIVDAAAAADAVSVRARMGCADTGLGSDSAACGFSSQAAASTSYTAPGTYQYRIPVWCRYIEIVLCGSGRGGNGNSNFLAGAGGNAGQWAAVTLERGVHIPWSLIFITIVVPDGGDGGVGRAVGVGGMGEDGSAATAAATGWTGLSAPGGSGERSGNQTGGSPGNYSYGGTTYPGGAESSTGNGSPGNAPGGGGRGGNGNTFGGFNGGKGAPGVAHMRARQ